MMHHSESTPKRIDEAETTLRIAKITALAQEILGAEKTTDWLNKPRKIFDGLSAMELIKTESGASLVQEKLIQLDEGYIV